MLARGQAPYVLCLFFVLPVFLSLFAVCCSDCPCALSGLVGCGSLILPTPRVNGCCLLSCRATGSHAVVIQRNMLHCFLSVVKLSRCLC